MVPSYPKVDAGLTKQITIRYIDYRDNVGNGSQTIVNVATEVTKT